LRRPAFVRRFGPRTPSVLPVLFGCGFFSRPYGSVVPGDSKDQHSPCSPPTGIQSESRLPGFHFPYPSIARFQFRISLSHVPALFPACPPSVVGESSLGWRNIIDLAHSLSALRSPSSPTVAHIRPMFSHRRSCVDPSGFKSLSPLESLLVSDGPCDWACPPLDLRQREF